MDEFAQEFLCQFLYYAGQIYKDYEKTIIEPFEIPETWKRVIGIDYGLQNPTAIVFGAIDYDGNVYIYDEHYQSRLLIKDHARAIMTRVEGRFDWTVADWDAQENAEMADCGISTVRAKKDVIAGIQRVKSRLEVQPDGRPRLYVHERCVNTLRELGMYRWDPGKSGNERETPIKELDHAMDALRYMVQEVDAGGFILV
jgi:phage terminase large subunit